MIYTVNFHTFRKHLGILSNLQHFYKMNFPDLYNILINEILPNIHKNSWILLPPYLCWMYEALSQDDTYHLQRWDSYLLLRCEKAIHYVLQQDLDQLTCCTTEVKIIFCKIMKISLHEKCLYSELFWPAFSRIRTAWSVRIRSYSGPYFPALGLNTERCEVSLRIQSKCGKCGSA